MKIRQPAVAGQFYPEDADELRVSLGKYLEAAGEHDLNHDFSPEAIRGILVPHAGYDYSAPVAAYAYRAVQGRRTGTVVLIGNSHTAYFHGVAIDDSEFWQSPLAKIPVDRELADELIAADKSISLNGEPHAREHSLEVQLPFLQTVLPGNFKILPILFGNTLEDDHNKLAKALADNLSDRDLTVISSDLSHYPAYADANRIDRATLEAIKSLDAPELERHIAATTAEQVPNEQTLICGVDAVKTVMELARRKSWNRAETLRYANSGDTAIGDKKRVVGYGAMAFMADGGKRKADRGNEAATTAGNDELTSVQKNLLLDIAKRTVAVYVTDKKVPEFGINDERLRQPGGAFVTLHVNGELRGCIGQIIPTGEPLWQVVRDMAIAACSEDPRFSPVGPEELPSLEYEVSVLSVPRPVIDWRKIELGRQGVIVRKDFRSGVFLPQVAEETGWDLEEFLSQLCSQKAGLPPDSYKTDPEVSLEVFTAQVF